MSIVRTGKFDRDIKRTKKRGHDLASLKTVIRKLAKGSSLPARCRSHALTGQWRGYRECNVEPDLLLIYRISGNELRLARLGSHSDLFK